MTASADPSRVDFEGVRQRKTALLRRAFAQSGSRLTEELAVFRKSQPWSEDYALFCALKDRFGGEMWNRWPDRGIRNRRILSRWKYSRARSIREGVFRLTRYDLSMGWAR